MKTFELDKEQNEKYEKWSKENPTDYTGAIGGGESFTFSPNSIGVSVTVKRLSGGEYIELDLTDVSKW